MKRGPRTGRILQPARTSERRRVYKLHFQGSIGRYSLMRGESHSLRDTVIDKVPRPPKQTLKTFTGEKDMNVVGTQTWEKKQYDKRE